MYHTGEPLREGVHLFANSRRDGKDGAAYLLINNSKTETTELVFENRAELYRLTAPFMRSIDMYLNGTKLRMEDDFTMPDLNPEHCESGNIKIGPGEIAFLLL